MRTKQWVLGSILGGCGQPRSVGSEEADEFL